METEVVNALAQGASTGSICAGLALAVVRNYLDKVVGTRPLGGRIVFQGGVASNAAVVAAFEQVLGRPVQVHPCNRISGAIGAALAARAARPAASSFRGFRHPDRPVLSSFECQHCPNRCEVNVIATGSGRAFFGDTCERYTSGAPARDSGLPNLAEAFLDRCEALAAEARAGSGAGGAPRIGLPRGSSLTGQLPFWITFWKHLGYWPILSEPSAQATHALGLKHLPANVCLPIRLTAGHLHALLGRGIERVFLPAVTRLPGGDPEHAYTCPYTMAVPFIAGAPDGGRCLAPVLTFESEEGFLAGWSPLLDRLGLAPEPLRAAYHAGMAAQEAVLAEFRTRARDALAAGGYRHAFGILGRPYAVFDSYVNLGLFERLRRLGVLALPMAFLPAGPDPAGPGLPWRHPEDICSAAAGLMGGSIHPVVLSSYGCGPDAFTLQRLGEHLEARPHLILELDEHRAEAGQMTRVEAFLDQLEGRPGVPGPVPAPRPQPPLDLAGPAVVRIPYFADHAFAYSGLFRHLGHDARVLPPPEPETLALGERHALGKECHPYSMILGDLLHLADQDGAAGAVFFFPGTAIPCLLREYGRGMQALLRSLGIDRVRAYSPTGRELLESVGILPLERFYAGLLAIELLVKALHQIRPYERIPGTTDRLHRQNLEAIEAAVAGGDVLAALDLALRRLGEVERTGAGAGQRPRVGLVGDLYTRVNPVANQDLTRWLEQQGLEVWPAPFQIDLLDFGISRNLMKSLAARDLSSLLGSGSIALLRTLEHWRVRYVVGARVARGEEPGYQEMRRLAAPYMPNEAHELLFLQVAKTVDFARAGVDGIANAICFGCMVGNAAAAVNERIRRDFDDLPILTAVYAGGDDPSRRLALDAFVSQVRAHHARLRE
jgi:predicted nucleotide-binding protein (sugar kinase/HSP70/actin superfamily)